MKVLRKYEKDLKKVNVGDQISISLAKFGDFTATAQKVEGNRVLFMFDDCVARHAMNKTDTNKSGYAKSGLAKWMKTNLFPAFPDELRDHIEELTLPTYGMMFGHDDFYERFEPDTDEQLQLMQTRKNRVADYQGDYAWYWLRNATKQEVSSELFAFVNVIGIAACFYASDATIGVRPVFWLVMA